MATAARIDLQQGQVQSERVILSALCQGTLSGPFRANVIRRLKRYRFADPASQVVFQAIASLHTTNPAHIKERLPGRVINLGLPDVDLREYFAKDQLDEHRVTLEMESLFALHRTV